MHSTSSSVDLALPGEFALHASCLRELRGTRSIVNLLPFHTCVDKCAELLQWSFVNSARHANAPGLLSDGNLADCVSYRSCSSAEIVTAHAQQAGKEN